jgi:small redox-active disulfide protein 2
MKIEVLGSGCARCKILEKNTREAVATAGLDAEVVKVEDLQAIMAYQIMATPAIAVDGKVISSGKLLNPDEIISLLQ